MTLSLDSNDVQLPPFLHDLEAHLHYEIYDGLPLMSKWMTLKNMGDHSKVSVSVTWVDQLQVNLEWSPAGLGHSGRDWLHVSSDAPHGVSVTWSQEKEPWHVYGAQQPQVVTTYNPNPVVTLSPGEIWNTCKVQDWKEKRSPFRLAIVWGLSSINLSSS